MALNIPLLLQTPPPKPLPLGFPAPPWVEFKAIVQFVMVNCEVLKIPPPKPFPPGPTTIPPALPPTAIFALKVHPKRWAEPELKNPPPSPSALRLEESPLEPHMAWLPEKVLLLIKTGQ